MGLRYLKYLLILVSLNCRAQTDSLHSKKHKSLIEKAIPSIKNGEKELNFIVQKHNTCLEIMDIYPFHLLLYKKDTTIEVAFSQGEKENFKKTLTNGLLMNLVQIEKIWSKNFNHGWGQYCEVTIYVGRKRKAFIIPYSTYEELLKYMKSM